MTDSIVRYNTVSNEDRGIVISESSKNEVYNNTITDSGSGIDLDMDSFENIIYNNIIVNMEDPEDALGIDDGAEDQNTLYSNVLLDSNSGSKTELQP
jgi:parallel beta-helix repeat protein